MRAIQNNYVVIPCNKNRKGYAYGVYDMKNNKYTLFKDTSSDTKSEQIISAVKGKEVTALLYNEKYDAYGVLIDFNNSIKPQLIWMHYKDLEELKELVLNYDNLGEIIKLDTKDEESFMFKETKEKFKNVRFFALRNKGRSVFADFGNRINKENFISLDKAKPVLEITAGDSNITKEEKEEEQLDVKVITTEEVENKLDIQEETTPETQELKDKEETTNDEIIETETIDDNVKEDISEQFDFLKEANKSSVESLKEITKSLNNAIDEFHDISSKYKRALTKINGEQQGFNNEQLVGVVEIIDDEDETQEEYDERIYCVYNTILKLLKTNDSISVPRVYYEHLSVIIHRNIFLSHDGEKYDAIAVIKLLPGILENMLVRVEYSKTSKYTRLTVLKELNNIELDNNDILNYEVKYNEYRKSIKIRG